MTDKPDTLNFFQLRDLADKMIRDGQGAMNIAVRRDDGMPKTANIIRRIIKIGGKEYYLID